MNNSPATRAALARFLRPTSLALIGASATPGSLGAGVLANLKRFEFPGQIHLINPNRPEIDGQPCLKSAWDLPQGVDCAVIAVPQAFVLDAVKACAARGVGGAVIFGAGFAESGEAGKALQEKIAQIAADAGMGPFGQGFGHAGDELCVALFAVLHHGLHGFQNGGVLFGVAVVGAEAGGQHPALFLREMFHRVVDECAVQRQLLIRRGGQ